MLAHIHTCIAIRTLPVSCMKSPLRHAEAATCRPSSALFSAGSPNYQTVRRSSSRGEGPDFLLCVGRPRWRSSITGLGFLVSAGLLILPFVSRSLSRDLSCSHRYIVNDFWRWAVGCTAHRSELPSDPWSVTRLCVERFMVPQFHSEEAIMEKNPVQWLVRIENLLDRFLSSWRPLVGGDIA
jgi:hypothetical protein